MHKTKLQKQLQWTPEHLFVAVVNSCLMSAFLLIADNSKFKFISFESNAVAKIEKSDEKPAVTEIVLKPTMTIASARNEAKAKRVLEMSEKAYVIANSIKTRIFLEQVIAIQQITANSK